MTKVPGKRSLLKQLAPLTHSQRMRTMALLGRDHAGTAELRKLLDRLDGGLYEWQLRLTTATAAREIDDVVVALRHPMSSVRAVATSALRLIPIEPSALTDLLIGAATADRRRIIGVIRALQDADLADELVETVAVHYGAGEAAALLPTCSEAEVRKWLPELSHGFRNWSSLASRHPGPFVDFVSATMTQSRLNRPTWWQVFTSGISTLAASDPDTVLDLWEQFAEPDATPAVIAQNLRRLASARPDRVLRLLLTAKRRGQVSAHLAPLRRHLPKAEDTLLIELTRLLMAGQQHGLATVFSRLAPSRRALIFEQATADMDLEAVQWPEPFLALLPHEVRAAETRRMLRLPAIAEDQSRRHELMAMLPIAEVWDELQKATTASDPERRGAAYRRLVRAVQYSRDPVSFDRLLDELQRLKNEQEPVRVPAYQALSMCPPSLITIQHMGRLLTLARFLVEARDSSWASINALTTLFQRVLKNAASDADRPLFESCINGMEILSGNSGNLAFGQLGHGLPLGGEHLIYDVLGPRIETEATAGRFAILFNLARSLGERAHNIDGLQNQLAEAIRSPRTSDAATAISLWLEVPGARGERLEELLTWDSSTFLVRPVFHLVSLMRQDLLDLVLSRNAASGRFAVTSSRQVPAIMSGFHRWTPKQWQRYGQMMAAAAANESTSWHRAACIRTMCRIPEIDRRSIRRFLNSETTVLVESALAGLAWSENPGEELETLASHAGTDRARVAMYAASRAARFAPPSEVDRVMRDVVLREGSKLTSRKEALRILGTNRPPGALQTLADVWAQRPLHRDQLIALASGLRSFPGESLTWEVLEAMAQGTDDEALALLGTATFHAWPERFRPRLAALVSPLVEHESSHVRHLAWPLLANWRHWSPDVDELIRSAIVDIEHVGSWRLAVAQLQRIVGTGEAPALLTETVRTLASIREPDGMEASALRDTPVTQRLRFIAQAMPRTVATHAPLADSASHLIDADRSIEAALFAVAAVNWSDPGRDLLQLAVTCSANGDLMTVAVRDALPAAMSAQRGQWLSVDLVQPATELALADSGSAHLAIALVSTVGPSLGWPAVWRDLLRVLRRHDDPYVCHAARSIFTAAE